MAETSYNVPFPVMMTETKYHGPAAGMGRHSEPEPEPVIDWRRVDALLMLMALAILERHLKYDDASVASIDVDVKFQLIERVKILMEYFRNPP